jgi:hypothetical protein
MPCGMVTNENPLPATADERPINWGFTLVMVSGSAPDREKRLAANPGSMLSED